MSKNTKIIISLDKADHSELNSINENALYLNEISNLKIPVTDSFILTSYAFHKFLSVNNLQKQIEDLLSTVHYERADSLMQVSGHIKKLILRSKLPEEVIDQVKNRFKRLGGFFKKPQVIVGEDKKNIDNVIELLNEVKYIWSAQFDPKHLIHAHQSNHDLFKGRAILIQKKPTGTVSGSINTSTSEIQTKINLNEKDRSEIKHIAAVVKKNIYIPLILDWVIDKNKMYITDAKPLTNAQKSYLVLIRHGESVWNAKGLWTGWTDVDLSEKGHEQAREAGLRIKDIHLDVAFTSALKRAQQTLDEIKLAKGQTKLNTIISKSLNERDYGDLTGKNKWEVEKQYGEEQFIKWRRGWDEPIPGGESLKDVYQRVIPYFKDTILPHLKSGKNVIIAAHGNSLRSLVKYLENITDADISKLEIGVGEILVYQIDEDGKVISKEIRNKNKKTI